MNKRLDIIVVHHKEPIFFVDRFFISLGHQSFKDYDITIVVNKDDNFDYKRHIKSRYLSITNNININVIKSDNTTQSAKRNLGIKSSKNPYILLCDCDDSFLCDSPDGLKEAMAEIAENTVEYASFVLCEMYENASGELSTIEKQNNDKLIFRKPTTINATTIHGKIFRRKEIEEYEVAFDESLSLNEEGCFTVTMRYIAEKLNGLKWNGNPFYVYRRNDNSTVHTCCFYPIQGLDQFITAVFKGKSKEIEIDRKINGSVSNDNRSHIIFNWYHAIMICITNTMKYLSNFTDSEELQNILNDNSKAISLYIKKFRELCDVSPADEEYVLNKVVNDTCRLKGCSKDTLTEQLNEFNKRYLETTLQV